MSTTDSIPVAPLSIWDPVHLGTDELGRRVEVTLAERNMLIGGEPGGGKSVALQLIVAHGALSADCRSSWWTASGSSSACGRPAPTGSSAPRSTTRSTPSDGCKARSTSGPAWLLDHKLRKITPDLGWPVYLMPVDEVAYYSATVGTPAQQKEFNALNRDIVARGRAPGIIPVEATQRPSADIIPTSLRDLFGYRWAFRCSTEACSDTILGPRLGQPGLHGHRDRPASQRAWAGCAPRTASRAGSRPPT